MAVHVEIEDAVQIVTIDRPERRNAVDRATATELLEAFEAFAADDDLRVAILTGANGTFCAGADLKAIAEGGGNRVDLDGPGPMGPTRLNLDKPVIAAIEGFAVAGGIELAVWCDLRVAATDAILGVYCRRWGVPLVDGGTIRLPRLIGASHANDLILTGRGVGGDEALRMGLVNRLSAPGEALTDAKVLARELAELPPICMRNDLRSSKDQWDLPIDEAIIRESELGRVTLFSGESLEGAARFAGGAGRGGSKAT
ncbi:MAG: crotonase/enoyl-CoA hydratase family protein [Acidimicrobiales bacterium]